MNYNPALGLWGNLKALLDKTNELNRNVYNTGTEVGALKGDVSALPTWEEFDAAYQEGVDAAYDE